VVAPRSDNLVCSARGMFPLGELGAEFAARRVRDPGAIASPVAFVCDSGEEAVGAAACLAGSGLDALILPVERATPAVTALLAECGYLVQWPDGRTVAPGRVALTAPGRVSLLTSGTTGAPKLVPHRWDSLFTLRRAQSPRPHRWLLTYQPGTYAWFQMTTLALFVPGQELVLADGLEPRAMLERAAQRQATAISATPTFWRFALLSTPPEVLNALAFTQVTLGGERVGRAVLDRLRAQFPHARLSHIYASTEVGAAIVVNDGQEGFPAAWLSADSAAADPNAVQVRVEDGTLRVRSPYASQAHGGWVDTGDSVEQRGDRMVIIGRKDTSFINVGGLKVTASVVEEALLAHPQVAWCRVYARTSALVGSLVAADVVLRAPAADTFEAETELARHAATRLPEHAVPRLWRILDSIPMTGNLKSEVA